MPRISLSADGKTPRKGSSLAGAGGISLTMAERSPNYGFPLLFQRPHFARAAFLTVFFPVNAFVASVFRRPGRKWSEFLAICKDPTTNGGFVAGRLNR